MSGKYALISKNFFFNNDVNKVCKQVETKKIIQTVNFLLITPFIQ